MTPLPEFMELNRSIILFAYGLVFFGLGMILTLQSRSYSRLDLARSLKWLAAFGVIHGLYEWGDLFIPLQNPNLSARTIWFWHGVQLTLLAISFACLFKFGISIFRRNRWLQYLPWAVLLGWAIVVMALIIPLSHDLDTWRRTSNALARYFMALPGGIISAVNLRRYALQRITRLNAPHIIVFLRMAGLALFLYAIFGGLFVPPVAFFPGSVINNRTLVELIQIPPLVFRSLTGLVLAVAMIRALEIFDIEYARRIEAMEQEQILAVERERIARELHDGALQTVYTAGLLVESSARLAEPGSQIGERLDHAVTALNHAIQDLRHNLVDLHKDKPDEPLKPAIIKMLQEEKFHSLIQVDTALELPEDLELSPLVIDHVISITREALTNVIRHARARRVAIQAFTREQTLTMTVEDDGVGLPQNFSRGFGMRNMRDRARLLGGDINCANSPERGTRITLKFPLLER